MNIVLKKETPLSLLKDSDDKIYEVGIKEKEFGDGKERRFQTLSGIEEVVKRKKIGNGVVHFRGGSYLEKVVKESERIK